jgi:hypothetical protein
MRSNFQPFCAAVNLKVENSTDGGGVIAGGIGIVKASWCR